MSALPIIPPKLALLIPRLASEHDGEVIATVRAMDRTLRANGADFHDLARAVSARVGLRVRVETDDQHLRDLDEGPNNLWGWRRFARACQALGCTRLSPREREFVASMVRQLARGREPSGAQAGWLHDIADRLRRSAR